MSAKFGSIDINSGIPSDGYMENGKMKFKKIPWYKRIFTQKPTEEMFVGTARYGNDIIEIELCVYRKYNPYTNETYEIYANSNTYGKFEFDINAFEQMGKLISK